MHDCPTLQLLPIEFSAFCSNQCTYSTPMDTAQDTLVIGGGEGMEMVDISLDYQ